MHAFKVVATLKLEEKREKSYITYPTVIALAYF